MRSKKETLTKQVVYDRNYRRARERALVRLSREYPTLYRQYLEEERRRDEQTGKAWIDYDIDNSIPVLAGTKDKRGADKSRQTGEDRSSSRNLGGEA